MVYAVLAQACFLPCLTTLWADDFRKDRELCLPLLAQQLNEFLAGSSQSITHALKAVVVVWQGGMACPACPSCMRATQIWMA